MKQSNLLDKGIEYTIPILKREVNGKKLKDKELTLKLYQSTDGSWAELRFSADSAITISIQDFLDAADIAEDTVLEQAFLKTKVIICDKDGNDRIFTFRKDFTMFRKKRMLVIEWYSEKTCNKVYLDPEVIFWGDYPITAFVA